MIPLPLALAFLLGADPVAEPPPSPPAPAQGAPGAAVRAEPPPTPTEPPPTLTPAPAGPPPAAPPEAGEHPPPAPPAEEEKPVPPPPAPPERIAPPPRAPASPTATPTDEPPDLTQPGGATPYRTPFGTGAPAPARPDERAGRPATGPPPVPATPFVREHAIQLGASAVSLAGLGATGFDGRLALSVRGAPGFRGTGLLAVDAFVGETEAGLQVRSLAVGAEGWIEPVSRVRIGAGVGLGLAGYKRATSGEWPVMLAPGLRVGAELAPLRWRGGAVVVGVHLAGYVEEEFWGSASLRVGLRLLGSPAPGGPGSKPEAGAVRAE